MEFESSPEQMQLQEQLMNEEEIRMLNSDFNYKHYGQFYEMIDKKKEDPNAKLDGKQPNQQIIDSRQIFNSMWNKVQLDSAMTANYE